MTEILERYKKDHHNIVKEWKAKTGKKVFGYFCCITPEEILYAADVLPVRITGTGEPLQHADQHIPPNACPYAKSCLDAGMRGMYDYLDGVVIPNSCDIIFFMESFWKDNVPRPNKPSIISGVDLNPYVHYVNYPEKVTGREVVPYYLEVLKEFKQGVERSLNKEITDVDLERAISVYNDNKVQMKRMYEMRKSDPPALSGYNAWQLTNAGLFMPKDEHTDLLKEYLDKIESDGSQSDEGVRLYLSGSATDSVNADLYKIIEESGGQVVSDDLCIGTRSFWNDLATDLPPMESIARRSLGTACPRSTNADRIPDLRWNHIKESTDGYNIEGAIFQIHKCCDARLIEYPHLKDKMKEELGVPSLFLEGDYTPEGLEQMRGSIEAFIEMIEG